MTGLIVALDTPKAMDRTRSLILDAGVRTFKLNAVAFMTMAGDSARRVIFDNNCDLFLDLKIYDVSDTVAEVARHAFNALNARFLTVYADPTMLAAAQSVARTERQKVIAVERLTSEDRRYYNRLPTHTQLFKTSEGFIFNELKVLAYAKADYHFTGISILPGVRRATDPSHHHALPTLPEETRDAGVDYAVVGRPITLAWDPVATALEFKRLLGDE